MRVILKQLSRPWNSIPTTNNIGVEWTTLEPYSPTIYARRRHQHSRLPMHRWLLQVLLHVLVVPVSLALDFHYQSPAHLSLLELLGPMFKDWIRRSLPVTIHAIYLLLPVFLRPVHRRPGPQCPPLGHPLPLRT